MSSRLPLQESLVAGWASLVSGQDKFALGKHGRPGTPGLCPYQTPGWASAMRSLLASDLPAPSTPCRPTGPLSTVSGPATFVSGPRSNSVPQRKGTARPGTQGLCRGAVAENRALLGSNACLLRSRTSCSSGSATSSAAEAAMPQQQPRVTTAKAGKRTSAGLLPSSGYTRHANRQGGLHWACVR